MAELAMGVKRHGPHMRLGAAVAVIALALDQLHKWWMLTVFDIADKRIVTVTPFLDLVLVWNKGVSYGWLQQDSDLGRYLLIGFTLAAVAVMIVWLAGAQSRSTAIALGLIIGGALGNGADRVAYGAVADFFRFHAFGYSWYIFNLADVAIVAGCVLVLYDIVSERRRGAKAGDSAG